MVDHISSSMEKICVFVMVAVGFNVGSSAGINQLYLKEADPAKGFDY